MDRSEFLKFLTSYCKKNYHSGDLNSTEIRSMLGKTIPRIRTYEGLKCADILSELTEDMFESVNRKITCSEKLYVVLENIKDIPICKNTDNNEHKTSFKSLTEGYVEFCSRSCSNKYSAHVKKRKAARGRKTITNQYSKEEFERMLRKDLIEKGTTLEDAWVEPRSLLGYLNFLKNDAGENYLDILESMTKVGRIPGERLYMIFKDIEEIPKCKHCKENDVEFYSLQKGYREYCSWNCQTASKEVREKQRISTFKNMMIVLEDIDGRLQGLSKRLFDVTDYEGTNRIHVYKWKCLKCANIFEDHLYAGHIPHCPKCFPKPKQGSVAEDEIRNFCEQYSTEVMKGDRIILEGREIDILMPNINLGIEYDSFRYHGDLFKEEHGVELNKYTESYHLNKTLDSKSKGINLIHIFEDEWTFKQDIVKSIILNKMGMTPNRIHNRKCVVKKIEDIQLIRSFLNDNHLQGWRGCKISLGLFYEDNLVSLLCMGKSQTNKHFEWEIIRFCNKAYTIVNNSLSRLFKHFVLDFNPESIITYSDARYGIGNSYINCGFKYKGLSDPSFWGVKKFIKYSRWKFRKVEKDENCDMNLTQWENMKKNGYDRIWDCGNYVYHWPELKD